ncbi:MAG: hypothetical protein MRK00_06275 [Nitrosomonas sp.]|nr:hypothetical protein [Nitrosomonas sp.]
MKCSAHFTLAAITAITYRLAGRFATRCFNMLKYFRQRMAVMLVLFMADNADDDIASRCTGD